MNGERLKDVNSKRLLISVDSGASENVTSERMAPQFEVRRSKGSRGGVKCVTASSLMNNKGEKDGEDQGGAQMRHENAGD